MSVPARLAGQSIIATIQEDGRTTGTGIVPVTIGDGAIGCIADQATCRCSPISANIGNHLIEDSPIRLPCDAPQRTCNRISPDQP